MAWKRRLKRFASVGHSTDTRCWTQSQDDRWSLACDYLTASATREVSLQGHDTQPLSAAVAHGQTEVANLLTEAAGQPSGSNLEDKETTENTP